MAVTRDVDLIGDTVASRSRTRRRRRLAPWGRKRRPVGLAGDYELRGDSLAIETPDGKLREVRAFFGAWAGTKPDSGTGERDWVAGDTVIVTLRQADSAGKTVTQVRQLEAQSQRKVVLSGGEQGQDRQGGKPVEPSLNYARADRIVVHMATDWRRWDGTRGPFWSRRWPAARAGSARGPSRS